MGKQEPQLVEEAGCNLGISIQVITTGRQSAKRGLFFKGRVLTAHSVSRRSATHLGVKTWTLVAVQQSSMGASPMELFISFFCPGFLINWWGVYDFLWAQISSILQPESEAPVALFQPPKALTGVSPQSQTPCCTDTHSSGQKGSWWTQSWCSESLGNFTVTC